MKAIASPLSSLDTRAAEAAIDAGEAAGVDAVAIMAAKNRVLIARRMQPALLALLERTGLEHAAAPLLSHGMLKVPRPPLRSSHAVHHTISVAVNQHLDAI